jgi:hypothetical protein
VAVLSAPSFTYAEAVWSEKLPDWIAAHVRAFALFRASPAQTVVIISRLDHRVLEKARFVLGAMELNGGAWPRLGGCDRNPGFYDL